MSTQQTATAVQAHTDRPLSLDSAYEYAAAQALRPGTVGRVGMELEGHVIDFGAPEVRPSWDRIRTAVDGIGSLPGRSDITLEPGGQLELSTQPFEGISAAIDALRDDQAAVHAKLAEHRLGVLHMGADPVRPPVRVNPKSRYAAMESYFVATGNEGNGRAMMCSTASLQVNVDVGSPQGWSERVQLAHRLGPVMVAMSACSPLMAGRSTGWRSTRQRIWGELDRARCGPLLAGSDPAHEWAAYAMQAPVMLVRDPLTKAATPMSSAVSFGAWADGTVQLAGRPPTTDDLEYHLTTLFPPVRLRGFVEIRYLDAVPLQWWPALAAVLVALVDDPVAADRAAEATEETTAGWTRAAHLGLADPALARAAQRCIEAALAVVAPELKSDVELYAELVHFGRSPGDEILDEVHRTDPTTAMRDLARA